MKTRKNKLSAALDAATPFERLSEGLDEARGIVERVRAGMSHEQAAKEARAESDERILARHAATQAAESKPAATQATKRKVAKPSRKATTPRKATPRAPSPSHAPPTA